MRNSIYSFALLISITLPSCTTVMDNLPGVYSLEIQQGNIINQEMIDQLRPKMTKRQVLYIMGSSMLIDVFHQERWDYLYSTQPGGESRRQKRLSLFFDGDELLGVQGDFRPSTLAVIRTSNESTIELPKRELDNTLWGKMTRMLSDDVSTENTATTTAFEPTEVNDTFSKDTEKQEEGVIPVENDALPEETTHDEQASPQLSESNQEIKNGEIMITPLQENQSGILEQVLNDPSLDSKVEEIINSVPEMNDSTATIENATPKDAEQESN